MIYRFALVEKPQVIITKSRGVPEPLLLSVNKTVRGEAIGVYYNENMFFADIDYYDHAALEIAERKKAYLSHNDIPRFGISNCGMLIADNERNWGNLKSWLLACQGGRCISFCAEDDDHAEMQLISVLFVLVLDAPIATPREVEWLLKRVRPALVAHDEDWARD